ncbi:MAG: hypothetical protein ACI3XP_03410 [Eubacteriales bacterium]
MNRKIAAILAALQLCMLFAACSGKTTQEQNGTESKAPANTSEPAAEDTVTLTEAERRALVSDDLPTDQQFGGRSFTIITLDSTAPLYDVEDSTGAALNDAIYSRNSTVESRFDVKIETLGYKDYKACAAAIQQAISSGDTEMFDLAAYHMVANGAVAVAGLYQNWYDIPHVNFEKPWWADSNVEDLTINGKCFIALGDVSINTISRSWCYILNKQLARGNELGNLYDLVRSGTWTIDKVREIAETVYVDVNADGIANQGDTFGLGSAISSAMNIYLWAFDNPIIKKDAEGVPQYVLNTNKLPDIVTTVVELYNHVSGVYSSKAGDNSYMDEFKNGNILLLTGYFANVETICREVDFEVGVLPYPKFDEAQENYYTLIGGGADSMGVSVIAKDIEYIGMITEALCAESYKQINPVYYDMMLKNRYADRPDDAEMMDLIVESRVYDIGYIYDNWKGAGFWMQDLVKAGNTAVASFYASKWPAAEAYYDTVLALFEN